jgi:hypothetical protein
VSLAFGLYRAFPGALMTGVVEADGTKRFPCPAFSTSLSVDAGAISPAAGQGPVAPWASARLARMVIGELPLDYAACPSNPRLTGAQSRRRLEAARTSLAAVMPLPSDPATMALVSAWASDVTLRAYGLGDEAAHALLGGLGLTLDEGARSGDGRFYSYDVFGAPLDAAVEALEQAALAASKHAKAAHEAATKTTPTSAADVSSDALFLVRDDDPALAERSAQFLPRGSMVKSFPDGTSLHATRLPISWPAGVLCEGFGRPALRVCERDERFDLTATERAVAANAQLFAGAAPLARLRRDRAVRDGLPSAVTFIEPGTATFRAALRRAGELLAAHLQDAVNLDLRAPGVPLLDVLVRGLSLSPEVVGRLASDAARRDPRKGLFSEMWESQQQLTAAGQALVMTGICRPGELAVEPTALDVLDPAMAVLRKAFGSRPHASTEEALEALKTAGLVPEDVQGGPSVWGRITTAMAGALGWTSTKIVDAETGKERRVYSRIETPVAATPSPRPKTRAQRENETALEVQENRTRWAAIASSSSSSSKGES